MNHQLESGATPIGPSDCPAPGLPKKPRRLRRVATSGAVVGTTLAGMFFVAPAAQAATVFANYQATTDVGERLSPTAAPDGNYGMPAGANLPVECQAIGQPAGVNGNTLYLRGMYAGRELYLPDAYSNSPHLAGQPPIAGIPMCNAPAPAPAPAPGPSPTWTRSIAELWALNHVGQNYDSGLCLTFVFAAYQQAGIDLRSQVNFAIGSNTYPVDLIGHITGGTTGTGTPPAGALVIYTSRYGRTYSHITIAVDGSGNTVSTSDSVSGVVHRETIAQHAAATGASMMWWLPAV